MAAHESHEHASGTIKSRSPFSAAFWFTIVLVGLFIAALNFINAMGGEEHEKEVMPTREASSSGTLEGETGIGRPKEDTTQHLGTQTASDTLHRENMH